MTNDIFIPGAYVELITVMTTDPVGLTMKTSYALASASKSSKSQKTIVFLSEYGNDVPVLWKRKESALKFAERMGYKVLL